MAITKFFDPKRRRPKAGERVAPPARPAVDRQDGRIYVADERITTAVNIAIATGRPLLLRGPTGCGKSSLAPFVRAKLGWRYVEHVVTSRTQARDLKYGFDAVRRLNDATTRMVTGADGDDARRLEPYIEPGVLWWAFDPLDARVRGATGELARSLPRAKPPTREAAGGTEDPGPAVVLLDEIDKADPDVPNDLLVALGSQRFRVEETGHDVVARDPQLVFVTTNEERALPDAFLRRCIILRLAPHSAETLVKIATRHFGSEHKRLFAPLAEKLVEERDLAQAQARRPPSTAEYLDALRAAIEFGTTLDLENSDWRTLYEVAVTKPEAEEPIG